MKFLRSKEALSVVQLLIDVVLEIITIIIVILVLEYRADVYIPCARLFIQT